MLTPPSNGCPYPQCPKCRRPLVDLARFDASDAVIRTDRDDSDVLDYYYDSYYGSWRMLRRAWEFVYDTIWARFTQRRLDRVLKDYPHSLYCAGCGYLLRQR